MSEEERQIFVRSQCILQRQREISQLFLDGIIGRNFSRGLAFYLESVRRVLGEFETDGLSHSVPQTTGTPNS